MVELEHLRGIYAYLLFVEFNEKIVSALVALITAWNVKPTVAYLYYWIKNNIPLDQRKIIQTARKQIKILKSFSNLESPKQIKMPLYDRWSH